MSPERVMFFWIGGVLLFGTSVSTFAFVPRGQRKLTLPGWIIGGYCILMGLLH